MKNTMFEVNTIAFIHPYMTLMVSSLFLIASHNNEWIQQGFNPIPLCLGVGGSAFLWLLNTQMVFEVDGVKVDEAVLSVAN